MHSKVDPGRHPLPKIAECGIEKLNEHYSRLPESELRQGLINFAPYPPDETEFLTTRLWDKYLPRWRQKISYMDLDDPEYQKNATGAAAVLREE